MAIKASGSSLAFSEIRTFWGDANSGSMSLSEYYAGGNNVFSGAEDEAGNDIPSSSTIKVSDFYSTHTLTAGATTNFSSNGTFAIPVGVSTLTITLYGGGGGGGMADESGVGGGGGGGGSAGIIQGTLTVSNNIQGNPTAQTIAVTVGTGGSGGSSASGAADSGTTNNPTAGNASSIVYGGQTTSAGGGGEGGGYNISGVSMSAGSAASNSIGSNFSASINAAGVAPDGAQAASGDSGSIAGTEGKDIASNPLSFSQSGSTSGGAAGSTSSNSAATGGGGDFGRGGGGAASIDRTGDHHWFGGGGGGGHVRIVVAS